MDVLPRGKRAVHAERDQQFPRRLEATSEGDALAREWMEKLEFSPFITDGTIKKHTKDGVTDWGAVCLELEGPARAKGLVE